jgi:hypothetical protein
MDPDHFINRPVRPSPGKEGGMDTALVFTWTHPVFGREATVLRLWPETKEFFAKLAADGKCSELETFFSPSAPFNFAFVRGPMESIFEIVDSDFFRTLVTKYEFLMEDWHYYTYVTGDQTDTFIDRYMTVGTELGYI